LLRLGVSRHGRPRPSGTHAVVPSLSTPHHSAVSSHARRVRTSLSGLRPTEKLTA
jgi:hypothetical protein